MKKTCCLIILVSLVLTSCAQNQYGENSSPMLGVGIGAIGGAILGQALGGDTTSTLIGGTVGALAGYAIAMHTESKTNKVQDARRTREMVPATQRNKPVLKISNKSIIPSKQIQPGEDVTVKVTYILFDESKPQQPVREKNPYGTTENWSKH